MRLSKRRRPLGVGMDMTPMIDVVFQLIIFFMTVSQQSELERLELQLPQLAGILDQEPTTITLNITHDDRLIVSGGVVDLPGLDGLLTRQIVAKQGHPELVEVVLRVDRRSDSTLVNRVMTRLKRAGISRTRIAVEVPGSG